MDKTTIIVAGLIAVFFIYQFVRGKMNMSQLNKLPKGSYILLDVRTPAETAEGMLEGALNIPLDQLANQLHRLDKNKPVYTYCASGNRSGQAVSILSNAGFQTSNLGGYFTLKGL